MTLLAAHRVMRERKSTPSCSSSTLMDDSLFALSTSLVRFTCAPPQGSQSAVLRMLRSHASTRPTAAKPGSRPCRTNPSHGMFHAPMPQPMLQAKRCSSQGVVVCHFTTQVVVAAAGRQNVLGPVRYGNWSHMCTLYPVPLITLT